MNCNEVRYHLKVIRKGYKNISVKLLMTNVLMVFVCAVLVLFWLEEPADEWHTTTFTLSHFEYRHTRFSGSLVLFTTDDREYRLSDYFGEIRGIKHQLIEGQQYMAIYSERLSTKFIRGLEDEELVYINVDESRAFDTKRRLWVTVLAVGYMFFCLIQNLVFAISCVRKTEKRRIERIRKSGNM